MTRRNKDRHPCVQDFMLAKGGLGRPFKSCGAFSYNECVITASESSTLMAQSAQGVKAKSMILKPSAPKGPTGPSGPKPGFDLKKGDP